MTGADRSRRRLWSAVVAVQLGVLLAALDATVVGTAMPTVIASLGGLALYPWVFSAYMLASTVVMPVFGGLSDRLGRRAPYLAGIGVFCLGSLVAGLADSMLVMVAGRAIQGIGAGGILALSLIIFGDLFAGPQRGRMQGYITSVWGFASIVGPLLGGLIVDRWSWRWVFYVNLPLGGLVVLLTLTGLSETTRPGPSRRLDLAGTACFLAGVTALMVAVLDAGAVPELAGRRLLALAVAALGLGAFLAVERGSTDPLLPLALFREAPFSAGSTAAFFSGAAVFSALVHVPLLLQWGRGADATTAGLALMTMSLGWSVGGLVAGQLVNRLGFSRLTVGGTALMLAGYVALAIGLDASFPRLLLAGGVLGLGMGLCSITLIVAVQTLIARERRGVATSAVLFFRNIGATLGVAVMGAILTAELGLPTDSLAREGRALPPALVPALLTGMGHVFWLGAGATACSLVAACFLPDGSPLSLAAAGAEAAHETSG